MSVLSYFDAHVISLPSRTDRRAEFARELSAIGVDGDDVRLFEATRPDHANGFPSVGTYGCFLSHLGVLRAAQANKPLLICEDDLSFSKSFRERITGIVDDLSTRPWGIFYGGHDTLGQPARHLEPHPPGKPIKAAHMIAFNVDVIPRVIAYLEGILGRAGGDPAGGPMHVDGAYSCFRRDHPDVITRLAVPPLGYQRRSRTDVHEDRWDDRSPLLAHLLSTARRVGNRLQRGP